MIEQAGANVIVSGSALVKSDDPAALINNMRASVSEAFVRQPWATDRLATDATHT